MNRKKSTFIICILLAILFFSCNNKVQNYNLLVENPSDFLRENEAVVIKISDLGVKPDSIKGGFFVFQNHLEIPCQVDDLDGDGLVDELTFLCNLKPQEKRLFEIVYAKKEKQPAGKWENKTHAQLMLKDDMKLRESLTAAGGDLYQQCFHHGPAFENEKITYRVYFDQRMSIDVYGKKHNQLELQKTNWYSDSTQRENGFGKDILWVGKTASIGAVRGWDGKKSTLIKPVESRTAKVVAAGPVRTIVEMNSNNWENNGKTTDLISRFTLYSGHREFIHEVFCSEKYVQLCTGLMKKENSTYYHNNQTEGLWGYNLAEATDLVADTFGVGIVVPENYIVKTAEDELNNLFILNTNDFAHLKWYGVAVWEKEKNGFTTSQEFFAWLDVLKAKINSPVKITVQ